MERISGPPVCCISRPISSAILPTLWIEAVNYPAVPLPALRLLATQHCPGNLIKVGSRLGGKGLGSGRVLLTTYCPTGRGYDV